jgi:hypothetical protein
MIPGKRWFRTTPGNLKTRLKIATAWNQAHCKSPPQCRRVLVH